MKKISQTRLVATIVRPNQNHAIDLKRQKWFGNTQRGCIKDLTENTILEIWPTKCSADFYKEDATELKVLTVTGVTYEKFKEKDSEGYYGKYHFKLSNTTPYADAILNRGGSHPDLNCAPIFKKSSK